MGFFEIGILRFVNLRIPRNLVTYLGKVELMKFFGYYALLKTSAHLISKRHVQTMYFTSSAKKFV